ncbi:MAG: hypothetical protein JWO36_4668 [Myxococcales bacterium]|nr:hypothetical protein [Myxococcales bacterium]
MFNEILTGKASLENKPPPAGPYRESSVPDVTLTCTDCQKAFVTKAGSGATKCAVCHVLAVQANAAASSRAVENANATLRRSGSNATMFRIMIVVAIAIGLGIFKTGMRRQLDEDARIASGDRDSFRSYFGPQDPFTAKVASFAEQMCSCGDAACARAIHGQFQMWSRSHQDAPQDDQASDAAAEQTTRYFDCMKRIQAPPPRP